MHLLNLEHGAYFNTPSERDVKAESDSPREDQPFPLIEVKTKTTKEGLGWVKEALGNYIKGEEETRPETSHKGLLPN